MHNIRAHESHVIKLYSGVGDLLTPFFLIHPSALERVCHVPVADKAISLRPEKLLIEVESFTGGSVVV